MNISYWVRRPRLFWPRLKYWVWERRHPDLPWMCPGTIRFCEKALVGKGRGLEFGSGRSTLWFAQRLEELTSVEHDENWYHQVKRKLADANVTNADYRFVPLDGPEDDPEPPLSAARPRYAAVADGFPDHSLDLVIVDGHYRTHCIQAALPKIRPGGYLLVDDLNLWPNLDAIPVPHDWPVADHSGNGLKSCRIWQAPKRP